MNNTFSDNVFSPVIIGEGGYFADQGGQVREEDVVSLLLHAGAAIEATNKVT